MAHARDWARSYGKSDPIDALAVARAALRETDLPTAQRDGFSRTLRLVSDHRHHLVAERARVINRLRWHLHELDLGHEPPVRALWRPKHLNAVRAHSNNLEGQGDSVLARLASELIERCRQLTEQIHKRRRRARHLGRAAGADPAHHLRCGTLHEALKARMADLPATLLRSITWDQGAEMARHLTIARSLGARVYFCDSRSPWQRGSNENSNGLLRDYFPTCMRGSECRGRVSCP
jgi:hypothetical protein